MVRVFDAWQIPEIAIGWPFGLVTDADPPKPQIGRESLIGRNRQTVRSAVKRLATR